MELCDHQGFPFVWMCVCETIFKSTSGSFSGNIYYANCNTTDNFKNKRESQQNMKYEQI